MARLARVVVPDVAHHVTQRGNRRQPVFFGDEDYAAYRDLAAAACRAQDVSCLAWCLMPNHVEWFGRLKSHFSCVQPAFVT